MRKKKIIPLKKSHFIKMTPAQHMLLALHEYGARCYNTMISEEIDTEARHIEYFNNYPFDEKAVREFLRCKKEKGYFEKFDVINDKLSDMLCHPNDRNGFRIEAVTVGNGIHDYTYTKYQVNDDEIYVTYNTIRNLSGGQYTSVLKKENDKYTIVKEYCHRRS